MIATVVGAIVILVAAYDCVDALILTRRVMRRWRPTWLSDGLIYDMINCGRNRQAVFRKASDFQAFFDALANLKERKPFELFGYCLLNNHVHLLVRPLEATISRIVQSLLVSNNQRYHKHYRSGGHVWQGRFKRPIVQNNEHVLTVPRYIEANQLRAGIVADEADYRWSSYREHRLGEASVTAYYLRPVVVAPGGPPGEMGVRSRRGCRMGTSGGSRDWPTSSEKRVRNH
jgi:REP element-mobilizing transposase RayT